MKIIYKNNTGGISIITPTEQVLKFVTIHDIAKKDVPEGVEYWLVSDSDIPSNRVFRDAWELDENELGSPSGVGAPFNEFPKDLLKTVIGGSDDQS